MLKKIIYPLLTFTVFYFVMVSTQNIIAFANWLSKGDPVIAIGFYLTLGVMIIWVVLIPIMAYSRIPSMQQISQMKASEKQTHKVAKYYRKTLQPQDLEAYQKALKNGHETLLAWVENHIKSRLDQTNEIIKGYAKKTTITVLISPNSFIDGLAILISNLYMLYQLSQTVHLRVGLRKTLKLYINIISFASAMGLLEEFDEMIEEAVEEMIEEIIEIISTKGVSEGVDNIPLVSILSKTVSPAIQAASNYAFVFYVGHTYQNYIRGILSTSDYSIEDAKKSARKTARRMRLVFIKDMSKDIGAHTKKKWLGLVKKNK